MLIRFPHHARTSETSRAAKAVKTPAVTRSLLAMPVARIVDHHSAGITLRCHHFETVDARAPISEAIASREGHSSITSRKDDNSLMSSNLGQLVLNCKANLSLDGNLSLGQTVRMSESDLETQYKQEFTARIKASRVATGMKQWQVAEALGVPQDHYKHWELTRLMPHHLIGRFCLVTRVDPVWLMTGRGEKPLKALRLAEGSPAPIAKPQKRRARRAA